MDSNDCSSRTRTLLSAMDCESMNNKIKLKAWFDEDSKLHIEDEDGREFDAISEADAYGLHPIQRDKVVQIKIDLEYPHWPHLKPHIEVTFRVPLDVRSKLMQEELLRAMIERG